MHVTDWRGAYCAQIHGVKKHDLKDVIASIANAGGSTLGGCGDINRNIMTPPAPLADPAYQYAFQTSNYIADLFAPSSPAFMEVGHPLIPSSPHPLHIIHAALPRSSSIFSRLSGSHTSVLHPTPRRHIALFLAIHEKAFGIAL